MLNSSLRFSILLLALIHASVESRFERDASDDYYFRQNVGQARQINISGQINGLNEGKSVYLSLQCVENNQVFPLLIEIYGDKIELSDLPVSTTRQFNRRFQNGPITIAITIFTNQFNIALVDEAGRFAHSFRPVNWFEEGNDFAHGKPQCQQREILYARDAFRHDAITVHRSKFIYTHHTPFMPGNKITFVGRIMQENSVFSVKIGSIDKEVPRALTLRVIRGEIVLKCSNRTEPERRTAVLPAEDVEFEIRIHDTGFTVQIHHLRINETIVQLRCPHGYALTDRNNLFIGPWSSIMARSPYIHQLQTPVYVARYKDESAYEEYRRIIKEYPREVKSTLNHGAFRYGLWTDTTHWALVPSYQGPIDFRFERLPYHFTKCPCDCLSDYTNVILMDTMHDVKFEDPDILRTIVFYQWLDGQGVRVNTDHKFILEIFTISSRGKQECDWNDSEICITSIDEEFQDIADVDKPLTASVFIEPSTVTDRGITIRHMNDTFRINAYGEEIEYLQKITFIQVFGLKSVAQIGGEGVLLS